MCTDLIAVRHGVSFWNWPGVKTILNPVRCLAGIPRQRTGSGQDTGAKETRGNDDAVKCPPLNLGPAIAHRELSPEAPGPHTPDSGKGAWVELDRWVEFHL